jgi:hypothetical protein
MARTVGLQPKAPPNQLSQQDKDEQATLARQSVENQTATLALQTQAQAEQKALIEKQTADLAAEKAKTDAATSAEDRARKSRLSGRLSLLNTETGTVLPAGPADLQRRLGA